MQMIGTESPIDYLCSSFGRIKSRRSSRVRPIQRSFRFSGTEFLIDCVHTPFGRIRSRRSLRNLEDIWSTNVMMETSDQVYMVISKWAYWREIFKMSWIFLLKIFGVGTFLCNVVFLSVWIKNHFFLFQVSKRLSLRTVLLVDHAVDCPTILFY
jgi:hypothetical protein